MSFELSYNNRIRYTIQHNDFTPHIAIDPIGYDEIEKQYSRHKTYHGMFINQSNSIKFIGQSKDFLVMLCNVYGINAEIRLIIEIRHPKTDDWVRESDGYLDIETKVVEGNTISFKYNAGTLFKQIKARSSQKLELERLNTIDGVDIDPLKINKVALDGRKIFLISRLEVVEENNYRLFSLSEAIGGGSYRFLSIPTTVDYKSDTLIHSVLSEEVIELGEEGTEMMFYADNDRDKTLNITIEIDQIIDLVSIANLADFEFGISLSTYENGIDYDFKSRDIIWQAQNAYSMSDLGVNFTYTTSVDLIAGESLALHWIAEGSFTVLSNLAVRINTNKAVIKIDENSFFQSSQANILLPYEAMNRSIQLMTNRDDIFYSDVLGRTDLGYLEDGEASLIGIQHGHWIRGFDKFPVEEDNKYKAITTSFKDLTGSYFDTWNLGLGIERVGFKEVVRVEKLSYFYNRNVTIRLGKEVNGKFEYIQVGNVKRTTPKEYYYGELEIGSEKGGEYEEAMGLDEPNSRATFPTVIRTDSTLKLITKYRKDSYGGEFARRLQRELDPTKDSKYDSDIWMRDLKRSSTSVFKQRLWQDDFENEPTGIYSPETATELRFSPVNTLLRFGWNISGAVSKYPNDYIINGSSISNSKLSTKKIGGKEYSEDGKVQNKDLERARYIPETVEFEYPVDFDLMEKIQGKTTILGKEIPNVYGLVEFKNEDGLIEKGYLMELKPSGEGKWELLKYVDDAK